MNQICERNIEIKYSFVSIKIFFGIGFVTYVLDSCEEIFHMKFLAAATKVEVGSVIRITSIPFFCGLRNVPKRIFKLLATCRTCFRWGRRIIFQIFNLYETLKEICSLLVNSCKCLHQTNIIVLKCFTVWKNFRIT